MLHHHEKLVDVPEMFADVKITAMPWNNDTITYSVMQQLILGFPRSFDFLPQTCEQLVYQVNRSRPKWITGPAPKLGSAGKSKSRGPENGVSRWRRPNSDIYSQNHHFGLVYDMIYQFLGMEAKNSKFGMFCQQCHPSVASGDADIRPRNASRIHTCHLFMS